MKIIKTKFEKDFLSVPTESKIRELLIRDKDIIDTNYKYVDINVGSCIKQYGLGKTQQIISKYEGKDRFFTCQHIQVSKLNFGGSLVFTPHSNVNDSFISIPHYSMNISEPKENKTVLFSFLGSVETHNIRRQLVKTYPNLCKSSNLQWGLDTNIEENIRNKINLDFIKNINDSKFSLCPRGTGISSIRLFESMAMGSIPIIIADGYDKPLKTKINWDEFSFTFKHSEIHKIYDTLSKIDVNRINEMKDRCLYIYNNYFCNDLLHKTITEKIINFK